MLGEGEPLDTTPSDSIYRPTSRALQGSAADDMEVAPVSNSTRAARRRMADDTTTIRPGWRELATNPATTTIIKTKHVSAPVAPRSRRLALISAAAIATIAAAAVSFGFLMPSANTQAPLNVALPAAEMARNLGDTVVNQGLAQDAGSVSMLQSATDSAAAALAADSAVQAQLSNAAALATNAGQMTLASAQASWAKAHDYSGSSRVDYSTSDLSGAAVAVPDGSFIWPVKTVKISSPFGWRTDPVYGGAEFHSGVDLSDPCGTPIYASGDGVVTVSGWYGAFGYYIEINHGKLSTGYGHQSKLVATIGEHVKQGDLIGYVGQTGKATGCHVHFQAINSKGQYFNPVTLIH